MKGLLKVQMFQPYMIYCVIRTFFNYTYVEGSLKGQKFQTKQPTLYAISTFQLSYISKKKARTGLIMALLVGPTGEVSTNIR